MRRLLSALGLFSIVWSRGACFQNDYDGPFKGWRIVRYDKETGRFFIWLAKCIDLKLYLDDKPQRNDIYRWSPDRPKKCTCTCCEVHRKTNIQ